MEKICEQCGETFTGPNRIRRYCGRACIQKAFRARNAAKRPTVNLACAHCDQSFVAANSNRRYKYCSRLCQIRAYKSANKDHLLALSQTSYYGKTLTEIREELWEKQQGKCYLCGRNLPGKTSATVDHDHRCCQPSYSCENCRRGLTCRPCNSLIGRANDDPEYLRKIADNLEKARLKVKPNPGNTEAP